MSASEAIAQPLSILDAVSTRVPTDASVRIARRKTNGASTAPRAQREAMNASEFVDVLRALVRDVVREELVNEKSPPDPLVHLSTRAAAEHAGVAMGTIRRWIRDGKLRELRAGRHLRVRRADVDALLAGEREGPDASPEALARQVFGG